MISSSICGLVSSPVPERACRRLAANGRGDHSGTPRVTGDRPALLDVNVPMYAAGQAHPYREACVWLMTEIAEGRLAAAIDTEIIQEILYRYGALQQWNVAVAMSTNLLEVVPTVYPVLVADAR